MTRHALLQFDLDPCIRIIVIFLFCQSLSVWFGEIADVHCWEMFLENAACLKGKSSLSVIIGGVISELGHSNEKNLSANYLPRALIYHSNTLKS